MGDAYDNALCESFFATLQCELLARHRFPTQSQARIAVFDFIEGWYNTQRRHSLDYDSPIHYERRHTATLPEPTSEDGFQGPAPSHDRGSSRTTLHVR